MLHTMHVRIFVILSIIYNPSQLLALESPISITLGERLALPGEFPYHVAIMLEGTGDIHCSGAIIGPAHVLSAANCMFDTSISSGTMLPIEKLEIVAGMTNEIEIALATKRKVKKVYVHPEYQFNSVANDIAVVALDDNLPMVEGLIEAIPIAQPFREDLCVITGWRRTSASNVSPDVLVTSKVDVVPLDKCKTDYQNVGMVLPDRIICAADEVSVDACNGDSGGPLNCHSSLTGIGGRMCAGASFPTIYTRTSAYLAWIASVSGTT